MKETRRSPVHDHPSTRDPRPARHGIQAHSGCGPSGQKNTRSAFGRRAAAQARPLMKNGFVHASLSIVLRRDHGHRRGALRRVARPGIDDVRVRASVGPEELLVAPGRRDRSVLQEDSRGSLVGISRRADRNRPAPGFVGRRPHAVDTAAGRRNQRDRAHPSRFRTSTISIDGVALADAAGIELHARPVEPHRPHRGIEPHVSIPTRSSTPLTTAGRGSCPSPL